MLDENGQAGSQLPTPRPDAAAIATILLREIALAGEDGLPFFEMRVPYIADEIAASLAKLP